MCIDAHGVFVAAVKPAWRGPGVIVRLEAPAARPGHPISVRLRPGFPVRCASLCDARERDLAPLPLDGPELTIIVEKAITSVRLV